MKTSKLNFIEDLIDTANRSIWKNELAIAYSEGGFSTAATPLNIEATKDIIKRDKEYVIFLEEEYNKEYNANNQ